MIPEIAPYNNYTGDGSTTQFDFDFYIEDASQLIVQHTASDGTVTTLTKDVDYSIHEVGNVQGSYITFPITGSSYSKLASGEVISLMLTLPIAQESEYGTSSELDLSNLEYSLDYLTRICQIMNRQVTRAIKVIEGSDIDTNELATDLTNVSNISDEVSIVAGIADDITAVKNDATNIDTVAGSITNVDSVGNSITNVNNVAADLTNIDAVANDLTNIDTVANDLTNIDTVAGSITNVDSVGNSITNVNNVAADLANIDAVAADLANIDAASGNAALAIQYAVGLPSEPDEGSAKYWAERAAQNQIQADWEQSDSTKKDYIKNKPTIPAAQIQADYSQSDNTKADYIKNKPDLSTKQDTLVSGINIKNINDTSILGDGNLELLDYRHIGDGILTSGTGGSFYSTNGRTLTLKAGMKVLMPDGVNSDWSLKNIVYTIPSDIVLNYSDYANDQIRTLYLRGDGTVINTTIPYNLGVFFKVGNLPSTVSNSYTHFAFVETSNSWYITSGSTTANWQKSLMQPILFFYTSENALSVYLRRYTLKLADTTMVDGKWTNKYVNLANAATYPTSSDKTFALYDYLPRDSYTYEILLTGSCTTGTDNGDHVYIQVTTDILSNNALICGAYTRTTSSMSSAGAIVLPVQNRILTITANSGYKGTYRLNIIGYRRMGMNA